MYSNRNFPRASKCNPNNQVLLKLQDENGKAIANVGKSTEWLSGKGYATVGLLKDKLPAGKYQLIVKNNRYKYGAADVSINFYASDEMPNIPIKENGEPKPLPYLAPEKIKMTSTPGAKDRGNCNGIYYQKDKKPFGDWYNSRGNRAIFYCPRFSKWACSIKAKCKGPNGDCSNLAKRCGAYQHSPKSD